MLPIVWFAIAFFLFLYALLFFSEWRARNRSHVRGCPSLPYLSQASLESLIVIEPDLIIVGLIDAQGSMAGRQIPDAHLVAIPALEAFLTNQSPRSVFVFYSANDQAIGWQGVERMVNSLRIPSIYVLKGGLAGWLGRHSVDPMAVVSQV
jgi:hypothetical protein